MGAACSAPERKKKMVPHSACGTIKYAVPKWTKLFFARADLIFLNFARADLIHFISRARILLILFRARGCQSPPQFSFFNLLTS